LGPDAELVGWSVPNPWGDIAVDDPGKERVPPERSSESLPRMLRNGVDRQAVGPLGPSCHEIEIRRLFERAGEPCGVNRFHSGPHRSRTSTGHIGR
jgi:hypothetical protein